ncbi:hypothetical protein BX616_010593 [Lobosporangium transversale]|nr:hypothetical protein BX616_010593 [Lobosporangium transversale]
MFVDDGSWASKLHIKDKAQSTVLDLFAIVKVAMTKELSSIRTAVNLDAELPEVTKNKSPLFQVMDL